MADAGLFDVAGRVALVSGASAGLGRRAATVLAQHGALRADLILPICQRVGAARERVPLGVSTVASTPLERMIEVAEGHAWFQLYFSGDGSGTLALVEPARVAAYRTLVVTLDVPEMANFRDGGFDRAASRAAADWSYLDRLRAACPGKLVIKGVLDIEDALRRRAAGVDAIQVSSHGGRQLDAAPPPILMLAALRRTLGPEFARFFDSGLRSGEDLVKAHAMGADFAFLGRPLLFAMAAGGEAGLHRLWEVLREDISLTLALLGQTDMSGIADCLHQGAGLTPPRG